MMKPYTQTTTFYLLFALLFAQGLAAQSTTADCSDPNGSGRTATCVWAGDTDNNGQVNHFDLLPIGLTYGTTGHSRPAASLDWQGQYAEDWQVSAPVNGLPNYKHIDTNGDGLIDSDDIAGVVGCAQFGQELDHTADISLNGNLPFSVESRSLPTGSRQQLEIFLGDDVWQGDVYGVAFTLEYEATKIVNGSVGIDFNASGLGSDLIEFQQDYEGEGRIVVALSRRDLQNIRIGGRLGTLNLTIRDDILRDPVGRFMQIRISNVVLIDRDNNVIGTQRPVATVDFLETPPVSVNEQSANTASAPLLFPNPTKDLFSLESRDGSPLQSAEIYSLDGRLIHSVENTAAASTWQISSADLAQGLYILQVRTEKGIYRQPLRSE